MLLSTYLSFFPRIARIFSWNAYTFGTKLVTRSYLLDATQRAAPMELVAGETYLLIAINKEDTGSDFIRVSMLSLQTVFGCWFAHGFMTEHTVPLHRYWPYFLTQCT